MKKDIKLELQEIKYLFGYERGRVISEQFTLKDDDFDNDTSFEGDSFVFEESFDQFESEEDLDVPVMSPGTKEKERTITTPGTKPGKKTPYRPLPGPKKNPKARKGEMPDWLTFNKLGINLK